MTEASARRSAHTAFDRAHDLRAEVLRELFRLFSPKAPKAGKARLSAE